MVLMVNNVEYDYRSLSVLCDEEPHLIADIAIERHKLLSVFEGIGEPVYVARMDTHEILYANDATRQAFGAKVGDKCFVALQGLEEPCDFCTNHKLKRPGDVYIWEFRNLLNGRWYRCTDRAIKWIDGSTVRLELAVDITEVKEVQKCKDKLTDTLSKAIEIIANGL